VRERARRAAPPKKPSPSCIDQLAGKIDADAAPDILKMQAIYSGLQCLGFIYSHGRLGIEVLDSDTKSLGLFPDRKAAADAVAKAGGAP
jgi:hypothetical protein